MRDECRAWRLCRLLDRTPSERSEAKLVFLINVRPDGLPARTRVLSGDRAGPLPSGMGIDDESDQVS
jgi:hypothetical protein